MLRMFFQEMGNGASSHFQSMKRSMLIITIIILAFSIYTLQTWDVGTWHQRITIIVFNVHQLQHFQRVFVGFGLVENFLKNRQ